MIRKMQLCAVLAFAISTFSHQGSVSAMEDPEAGSIVFGLTGAAMCMAQPTSGSQGEQQGAAKQILIPARYREHFETKGFVEQACSQRFRTERGREQWRNWICTQSSKPADAFQQGFERRFGEGAAVLCAAAEFVSGPWGREIIDEDELTEAEL